jgi:hypothetical protein
MENKDPSHHVSPEKEFMKSIPLTDKVQEPRSFLPQGGEYHNDSLAHCLDKVVGQVEPNKVTGQDNSKSGDEILSSLIVALSAVSLGGLISFLIKRFK